MKADRRTIAWKLVQRYMTQHMREVPAKRQDKFTTIDQSRISPLGALVSFELARRKMSYSQAAVEINRKLPDWLREARPSIAPSTLFYFKHETRAHWRAQADTIQQLAYGFDWDQTWLHRINCDPMGSEGEEEAMQLPEPIARVVKIMRDLPDEDHETICVWVAAYAESQSQTHTIYLPPLPMRQSA